MKQIWKDAVSAVFMGAIVVSYVLFLNSTTAWLISSARGTAAAVLVLGSIGGCGLSAAGELYRDKQAWAYTSFASVLGATALIAGILALITASTVALAVLVVATLALWLVATVWHASAARGPLSGSRETHEVIHPQESRR